MSGFYLPFMRALHEGLGGAVTLSAITHVGLGGLTGGQIFGLEEQIEHKRRWVEEHVTRPGSPPCALIGHSIGEALQAGMCSPYCILMEAVSAEHRPSMGTQARTWRCGPPDPSNRACQRPERLQDRAS